MEKKVKQRELTLYEQKIRKRDRLISSLQRINMVLVAVSLWFNVYFGAVFAAFSVYSWFFYNKGYKSNVIDEWEDGYVEDGLIYLFKGWLWLAGIVVAADILAMLLLSGDYLLSYFSC